MLLPFGKNASRKTNQALDAERDISQDVTEADFIPYACHFDTDTLLTKNGELLQILCITGNADGVDYEMLEDGVPPLYDAIRRAIGQAFDSDQYAFWFHTVRRRRPITARPEFREAFAQGLHKAWQKTHSWHYSYGNEIYISVLRQGQSADLFDFKQIPWEINPARNRKFREEYADEAKEDLQLRVDALTGLLEAHSNIRRLGMVERKGADGAPAFFSEPLEFLHYLVNMKTAEMPVSDTDLSVQLSTHELTFGFDALETRGAKRRFAAVLTLKGAPEVSPEVLDKCLQLPEDLIITQAFNYVPPREVLHKKMQTKELLEASDDPYIYHASGLKRTLEGSINAPTDFGMQQTSVMIVRDYYRHLDDALGRVQSRLASHGLIAVREDMLLEDCFWGQLPGNFEFLRRKSPLSSLQMGGLMRLNHFPSGLGGKEPWGAPVAILPTRVNTPYFFHFHVGETGHTAVLDFNSFADERGAVLVNFLLASARQFGGRTVVLDRNHTARPLVEALGGRYVQAVADDGEGALKMNPLRLDDTPRNRAFLAAWLAHFLDPEAAHRDETREKLVSVLDALYAGPPEGRTLKAALALIAQQDSALLAANRGALAALFSGSEDTVDFTAPVQGIEMRQAVERAELTVPVFSYLLHRIILTLDGSPTIIVLHEAWDLLDNPFFSSRIASLLDMLKQHNALMIFTTRHFDEHAESYLTRQILAHTPTQIVLPDDIPVDYFPEATSLTPRQVKTLVRMERQKGEFLLKRGREVVECVFSSAGLEEFRGTLAGDARSLRLMQIQQR